VKPLILQFGDFQLDSGQFELRRGGRRIRLERKPMELLILLTGKQGQLVPREEIIQQVWGKDVYFDAERGVNNAIRKIRSALNDNPNRPRFVETIVGKGYRFIALVDGAAPPVERESQENAPARARISIVGWAVTAVGLLAILVVFSLGSVRERLFRRSSSPEIQSVAVLPLENLSGEPAQDYFADGMTDAITTELAQISALKVISRTSVMQYKGTRKPLPQIANELGVDAVVEGAVQRSGDKVGITVQLIEAPSDRHLLAESYERGLGDVLGLQREIAHAIADEVKAKLTPPENVRLARTHSINSEAYEDYLKGRYLLSTERDVRKGIAYFERAIQKDPNYALAYAGLANSYIFMGEPGVGDAPKEALPQAKAAAIKALAIDDSLGEAHSALAHVIELHDWDWQGAEKEYRRALELNPNDALAYDWYGEYLQAMGRNEEGLAQVRRAMRLDPLNAHFAGDLGYHLYTARQYDEAIRAFQKTLELEPDEGQAHLGLGWVYVEKKMYGKALAELEKVSNLWSRNDVSVASLGQVLACSGRKQEARRLLEELEARSKRHYTSPYLIALVRMRLGERDLAIASLEQGYTNRDQWMMFLKADPRWDDLRSDLRFQDLIRRVGLPQ
jgi:TolB-like protein/DNA-binding winged helix-turn-helix (wHTH) protein/Tfp pilus assembly protein PilF